MTRSSSPTSAPTRCCCTPTSGSTGKPVPNRLKLIRDYVARGGGLMMIGGYFSLPGHQRRGPLARARRSRRRCRSPACRSTTASRCPEGFRAEVIEPATIRSCAGLGGDWPLLLGVNEVKLQDARGRQLWRALPDGRGRPSAAGRRHARPGPHGGLDVGHRPALAARQLRRLGRLRPPVAAGAGLADRQTLTRRSSLGPGLSWRKPAHRTGCFPSRINSCRRRPARRRRRLTTPPACHPKIDLADRSVRLFRTRTREAGVSQNDMRLAATRRSILKSGAGAAALGALGMPFEIRRARAQGAFDWKRFKGQKIEVFLAKSPRGDLLHQVPQGVRGADRHRGRLRDGARAAAAPEGRDRVQLGQPAST